MQQGTVWKRVWTFYALACALIALLAVPLWRDPRGLHAPYFSVLALVLMWTPALAAWLTVRISPPQQRKLRDRFGWHKPKQLASSVALGLLLPLTFSLGSIALGVAFGVYAFDVELSGLAERMHDSPAKAAAYLKMSTALLLPACVLNALPALGEELGWRGFLHDELRALPALQADALTGVLGGLWHAPLILLGYNYPAAPVLGAFVLMPIMCVPLALWIGWLRRRSGSVFIAALAHGATNAAGTLALAFYRAGSPPDAVHTTTTGWTGVLLPVAFCSWLIATQRISSGHHFLVPRSAQPD